MPQDEFIRLSIPLFRDWSLWEGMVNPTLVKMVYVACQFWALAGIAFAVECWTGYRASTQSRKP